MVSKQTRISKKQIYHTYTILVFRKNKRLFISAVYRRNIEMLKISLCWEKLNESLYQKMIRMLEKDNISSIELRKLQDEMFELFNYR